eukprot:jgi/Mesvir1/17465/Mv26485-RA.1
MGHHLLRADCWSARLRGVLPHRGRDRRAAVPGGPAADTALQVANRAQTAAYIRVGRQCHPAAVCVGDHQAAGHDDGAGHPRRAPDEGRCGQAVVPMHCHVMDSWESIYLRTICLRAIERNLRPLYTARREGALD